MNKLSCLYVGCLVAITRVFHRLKVVTNYPIYSLHCNARNFNAHTKLQIKFIISNNVTMKKNTEFSGQTFNYLIFHTNKKLRKFEELSSHKIPHCVVPTSKVHMVILDCT